VPVRVYNNNCENIQALKKIELPSEALAKELQRHLQERRFPIHDRVIETILVPDDLKPSEWSSLKGTVEKWASGKQLKVVESLKLQPLEPTKKDESNEKEVERLSEVKKKLDSLTPEMAEQRYNYLQNLPIGELTDEEYDERLELALRDWKKDRKQGGEKHRP
jgi:hypothetical protein